jgi:cell division septation protein DedD
MMAAMAESALRFRRDLTTKTIQADDGYTYVEIDTPTGQPYRLYEFEFQVALELDGRPYDEAAATARARHGLDITAEQVETFAKSLAELGLLESDGAVGMTVESGGSETRRTWTEAEPTALMTGTISDLVAETRARTGETPVSMRPSPDLPSEPTPTTDPRIRAEEGAPAAPLAADSGLQTAARARPETAPDASDGALLVPTPMPEGDAGEDVDLLASETLPETLDVNAAAPIAAPDGKEATTQELRAAVTPVPRLPPHDTLLESAPAPAATLPAPAPTVATAPAPARKNKSFLIWAILGLVAAAAAAFAIFKFALADKGAPVSVHTIVPTPLSVYRFFPTEGEVKLAQPAELAFATAGKLVDIKPQGARFSRGDVLAMLEAGRPLQRQLDHLRERRAFYRQMLETMTAEGNRPEMRQAEIKLREKTALLEEVERAFLDVAIVAATDGEIGATLAVAGDRVGADQKVLRLAGERHQAVFEFGPEDAARAARLTFCRIEIAGQPFDCTIPTAREDAVTDEFLRVDLAASAAVTPGTPARLARTRFDAVFTVPSSAVVSVGAGDRLYVAAPTGRAEVRAISVAGGDEPPDADNVIVTQGLDVGDAVIVDVPARLGPNTQIAVASSNTRQGAR